MRTFNKFLGGIVVIFLVVFIYYWLQFPLIYFCAWIADLMGYGHSAWENLYTVSVYAIPMSILVSLFTLYLCHSIKEKDDTIRVLAARLKRRGEDVDEYEE